MLQVCFDNRCYQLLMQTLQIAMLVPVITKSGKILAERVDGNTLNKAFVFGEHPQLMTYIITITVN